MTKRKKLKKLYHSIYYDPDDLSRRYMVECSPAKQEIVLMREIVDILKSKQGTTIGCTNSNCAVRMKDIFPHPVIFSEFTKTSVYILDKLDRNGQPKHCVWYKHNDGESVDLNDVIVDRKELAETIDHHKKIRLLVPRSRAGIKKPTGKGPRSDKYTEVARRKVHLSHGAKLRAQKAGFFFPQTAP